MAQLIHTWAAVKPGKTKSVYLNKVAKTSVHLFEVWARPTNTVWAGFKPPPYNFTAQVTAVETQGRQIDWVLDSDDERVWIQVKNTGELADLDLYFGKV